MLLAISVISVAELAHGAARARRPEDRLRREQLLAGIEGGLEVVPVTFQIAGLAGRVGGELASQGITIDFADLLIGVTALHIGYGVMTSNMRHFSLIPGLEVVSL